MLGQVVALPTTMIVFAAMGVADHERHRRSSTAQPIWDPVKLVGRFATPLVVAISMFTVVVATLAVNIAANVVSPANDFANAFPRLDQLQDRRAHHRHRSASLMQPWKLLADPSGYIFTWLLGYSGGLGSIAGVLIADYWLVRRKKLRARGSLPGGRRLPYGGWNLAGGRRDRCSAARSPGSAWWCRRCGRSTTTPGSSGFGVAFVIYAALMQRRPVLSPSPSAEG